MPTDRQLLQQILNNQTANAAAIQALQKTVDALLALAQPVTSSETSSGGGLGAGVIGRT